MKHKRKRYNHKPSIKCLECGRKFVRPLTHVWQVHGLTGREYKELHGLDVKRGIATEEYREVMRSHSEANRKVVIEKNLLAKGKKSRFKKGDDTNYVRSKQTRERLKKHWTETVQPKGIALKKARRLTVVCETCGNQFERIETQILEHVYCSRSCATISNNRNRKKKHQTLRKSIGRRSS